MIFSWHLAEKGKGGVCLHESTLCTHANVPLFDPWYTFVYDSQKELDLSLTFTCVNDEQRPHPCLDRTNKKRDSP